MKGGRRILGLCLLVAFSVACALTGKIPSLGGSQAFSAQADSPASVGLKWQVVNGASGYLLEGQYGKGNFSQVAKLAEDRTEFTHFVVPGSAQNACRLTATTGTGNQEIGTITVRVPKLVPNPLRAEAQPFALTTSGIPDSSWLPTIGSYPPDLNAVATLQAMAGA
jgi:hypothetical protein